MLASDVVGQDAEHAADGNSWKRQPLDVGVRVADADQRAAAGVVAGDRLAFLVGHLQAREQLRHILGDVALAAQVGATLRDGFG